MYRSHVLVCGGTGCTSSGSPQIMDTLKNELKRQGLEEEVAVVETGCHGLCALGPIMIVYPDATFYSMVQPGDIPEIVSEHLLKGRVVTRLLYQETVSPTGGIKALSDTDFYKKQHRIALRNCGVIDPENIEEYIGTGGYQALGKVLTEMTPEDSGSILWAMESERYMEIDAECRTGSITISIPETMDPGGIGYDIECENGTVEFPGFTVEGNQKKEAAGSLSVMDLEAGSGTISVQHTAAP